MKHLKCITGLVFMLLFSMHATSQDLVITEIMYDDPTSGTDSLEFIEILNSSSSGINILDYYLSEAISITFPDTTIQPGEYIIVAKDSAVFNRFYGCSAFEWTGILNNGGETIRLFDNSGHLLDSVSYDNTADWPDADGTGSSLVLCNPYTDNNTPENWLASNSYVDTIADGSPVYASPGNNDGQCFAELMIIYPADSALLGDCSFTGEDTANIIFMNIGNMPVLPHDTVHLNYTLEGSDKVWEYYVEDTALDPNEATIYSFDSLVDLSTHKIYGFTMGLAYKHDNDTSNNQISARVESYEFVVDLGPDTLTTALPVYLDAGEGVDYLWNDNSTDSTLYVDNAGIYHVMVIDSNGCQDSDTIVVKEDSPVSIQINADGFDVKLYPNPNNGIFAFKFTSGEKGCLSYELYNILGIKILDKKINNLVNYNARINLTSYPPGIYYLHYQFNGQDKTIKVIYK
jgi:hypothetical protein